MSFWLHHILRAIREARELHIRTETTISHEPPVPVATKEIRVESLTVGESDKAISNDEEQKRMREKLAEIHVTLYILKSEAAMLAGDKGGH